MSSKKGQQRPGIFPLRLHELLDQAERNNPCQTHIISWLPDGRSFKVHDKKAFASQVMPAFFGSSIFKSFQRNLNLWGYETISKGSEKGKCFNPYFIRGFPDLCRGMKRVTIKGMGSKQLKSAAAAVAVAAQQGSNLAQGYADMAQAATAVTEPALHSGFGLPQSSTMNAAAPMQVPSTAVSNNINNSSLMKSSTDSSTAFALAAARLGLTGNAGLPSGAAAAAQQLVQSATLLELQQQHQQQQQHQVSSALVQALQANQQLSGGGGGGAGAAATAALAQNLLAQQHQRQHHHHQQQQQQQQQPNNQQFEAIKAEQAAQLNAALVNEAVTRMILNAGVYHV